MRLVILAAVASTVFVAGCADAPPLDRTQYLAATTRIYPGKPKELIVEAATRILEIAGPTDYSYTHTDDGFVATYLNGQDTWDVKVRETSAGSRVSVQVNSRAGGGSFAPTTSPGTFAVVPSTGGGMAVGGTATYDLFFGRLDYMLRKSDRWPSCADSKERIRSGAATGTNDSLCRVAMFDDVPGKPRTGRKVSPQEQARIDQQSAPLVRTTGTGMTPDRP